MKNMIIAFMAVLCGVVLILIGFTIHGRDVRQVELDNALGFSMENAMKSLLYESGGPENEEEWKAAFLQSLSIQINSNSNLSVNFLEADMEKGILSVEATLTWVHPIGTLGQVSSARTILLDEFKETAVYGRRSAQQQKVIDAGYGNVVDWGDGTYSVLVHADFTSNGRHGWEILDTYLEEIGLAAESMHAGVIEGERDWYVCGVSDVHEIAIYSEEIIWN